VKLSASVIGYMTQDVKAIESGGLPLIPIGPVAVLPAERAGGSSASDGHAVKLHLFETRAIRPPGFLEARCARTDTPSRQPGVRGPPPVCVTANVPPV